MNQPSLSDAEHVKARWWREIIIQMTRAELAQRIGVSESRILDIEAGKTRGTGKPVDEATMQRYRMACAALTLGIEFDWLTCTLRPVAKVQISVPVAIAADPIE
jgi:transcriptional regulator with XRE-family HTH domain